MPGNFAGNRNLFLHHKTTTMKLLLASALLILVACKSADKKEITGMSGVYKMLSQRIHNDKTDTTYTTLQQLKIFTDKYMMYANFNPKDSVSSFGIGTYTINKDTILEDVFYNASDTTYSHNPGRFTLVIEKTPKGYKQEIPSIESGGQKYVLNEEYEALDGKQKTAIDGAWRQVKFYSITGNDTTTNTPTQFKMYHNGYVIWGHTNTDSLNISHAGMGYGKFEMPANNKIKESIMVSTYYLIRGHDFDLDIEMNGPDEYTQTIHNTDGSRSVEIYKRLK